MQNSDDQVSIPHDLIASVCAGYVLGNEDARLEPAVIRAAVSIRVSAAIKVGAAHMLCKIRRLRNRLPTSSEAAVVGWCLHLIVLPRAGRRVGQARPGKAAIAAQSLKAIATE